LRYDGIKYIFLLRLFSVNLVFIINKYNTLITAVLIFVVKLVKFVYVCVRIITFYNFIILYVAIIFSFRDCCV